VGNALVVHDPAVAQRYGRERITTGGRLETTLNVLPQFMMMIDGLDIHFIHVRSRHPIAPPLLITHGWPGSVLELVKAIGPLPDPTAFGGRAEDAFDVVIPVHPQLWLFGQAEGDRLESRPHRARLGRAHETRRIHPLCVAGRGLTPNTFVSNTHGRRHVVALNQTASLA
jgi:hypothetical protein